MTDGADIVDRLKLGNLDVGGSAASINALLRLHREAAGEIERLRTAAEAPLMDGTEKRLRDYAANPAASGMVPVHPDTLRKAADEIERLRSEFDCLNGLWRKLVEEAREAGHVNTEENDFGYLLMSLRMGPHDCSKRGGGAQ